MREAPVRGVVRGVRSYAEVGRLMGISRERVFQIEQRALAKLRNALRKTGVVGLGA